MAVISNKKRGWGRGLEGPHGQTTRRNWTEF